jgi:hypothetical protein
MNFRMRRIIVHQGAHENVGDVASASPALIGGLAGYRQHLEGTTSKLHDFMMACPIVNGFVLVFHTYQDPWAGSIVNARKDCGLQ